MLVATAVVAGAISSPMPTHTAIAQAPTSANQALTLRSDIQEANAVTGVITARGNVQINYPARQIQATSVQAQYYSRERRIVLSGNVYVLQNGNSLRGETVTYLIDEGRFVAVPDGEQQVEAIYIVPDPNPPIAPSPTAAVTTTIPSEAPEASPQPSSDFNPKPEFKTPISPPTSP
ncbi:organic solvent tolerance protein OstA [Oscillatoria sp. FACHB-1407]|nr:organic solvent tolerance protein OstA [Oscillatoria sp. FACHB-1407]